MSVRLSFRAFLAAAVSCLVACSTPTVEVVRRDGAPSSSSSSSSANAEAKTSYYGGTITVTSPDGKTPFGPPTATFVARTVDPAAGTIVERTIDDGKERVTTLKRRGDSAVFDASDDANSFRGTVTFTGEAWAFSGWSYAIAMNDKSGTITGTATITSTTITTEKRFTAADGVPRAKIVDALTTIDKAAYDAGLSTLREP